MSTRLWVTADELSAPDDPAAFPSAVSASFLMWALSGRKYGGARTTTERYECPCHCGSRSSRSALLGVIGPNSLLYNTALAAVGMDICGGCGAHHGLRLRGRPIRTVEQIVAGGTVLLPTQYEILDDVIVAPTAGAGWSLCSKVEITYTYGAEPPESGRRAARLLAEELLKAQIDPGSCALPDRVTSISRQGVSFTVLDPQNFLDDGRLGIYEVDAFLRAVNPDKARKPARVYSPDMPRARRVRQPMQLTPTVTPNDLVITRGEAFTHLFEPGVLPPMLDGVQWHLSGQVNSWNGSNTLPLNSTFGNWDWDPPTEKWRLSIPADQTEVADLREGAYDLYAVLDSDGTTAIHILSGRVFFK